MEQRTSDWHSWRAKGIGASEAPIIMKVSPWSTPFKLWELKTGRVQPDENGNWATQRGNELEPRARAWLEIHQDADFAPKLAEHPEYPFMRASLDGYNADQNLVLEIKCPGRADHALAEGGQVPDKYYPQLQHQLFVTGARQAIYFSYYEDKETRIASGHLVRVDPDPEYMQKLFAACCEFWKCVQTDTPPAMTDKDFVAVRSSEALGLLDKYTEALALVKHHQTIADQLKCQILAHPSIAEHDRCRVDRYRINTVIRKGNIQYAKIPEIQGLDLEKYRAKDSVYQVITLDRSSKE